MFTVPGCCAWGLDLTRAKRAYGIKHEVAEGTRTARRSSYNSTTERVRLFLETEISPSLVHHRFWPMRSSHSDQIADSRPMFGFEVCAKFFVHQTDET